MDCKIGGHSVWAGLSVPSDRQCSKKATYMSLPIDDGLALQSRYDEIDEYPVIVVVHLRVAGLKMSGPRKLASSVTTELHFSILHAIRRLPEDFRNRRWSGSVPHASGFQVPIHTVPWPK